MRFIRAVCACAPRRRLISRKPAAEKTRHHSTNAAAPMSLTIN
jgi:hypothetical protein